MRNLFPATLFGVVVFAGLVAVATIRPSNAAQAPKAVPKVALKPDVAALIKQSTEAYKKFNTYRHTAKWTITVKGEQGDAHEDLTFTMALERPNKFVYKLDTHSRAFPPVAAFSDGMTFINFKSSNGAVPTKQYTKTAAPKSFKGINIVDDVEFQPIATYIIALMLHGDALADKDVLGALQKASIKPSVTENGKKWQVLDMYFRTDKTPITLFIGEDDHLIGKAIQKGETSVTETLDAIQIDKPIAPATFQYVLPTDAKQVQRFTAPQRPDDARLLTFPNPIA